MKIVGIVCEYNPLHRGHKKQMDRIREHFGPDTAIVCAMSGNYVQRGMPAILDKSLRAQAAILCGADLVLELPVTVCLSSAEGFAAGGVKILSQICDCLCFGAETAQANILQDTAKALLSKDFPPLLREEMEKGMSFPAARQAALAKMGMQEDILSLPNDILAVEYCKAMAVQGSSMDIFPIHRGGSYHAQQADFKNPSATSVRKLMLELIPSQCSHWRGNPPDFPHNHDRLPHQSADRFEMAPYLAYIPEAAQPVFADAALHAISPGERAILAKLRTMTDADFEALPYGSEGLWRKFMHACGSCASLEEIIAATKSKRYTRTRLDRMVMCAFLGITKDILDAEVPYTRVLAMNDRGRGILKEAKKAGNYQNPGESVDHPHWELEKRCGDLYGLFAVNGPEAPGIEEKRRIVYLKNRNHENWHAEGRMIP